METKQLFITNISKGFSLDINCNEEFQLIPILTCFGFETTENNNGFAIKIDNPVKFSNKIKKNLNILCKKLNGFDLRKWLDYSENGDLIYLTPFKLDCSSLIKTPLLNEDKNLLEEIKKIYKMSSFSEERFHDLNVNFKSDERKCLFCGKTKNDGATFSSKAHAISEFLGNKILVQNDECDNCNNIFGATIENDLAIYFEPFRMLAGVKGKEPLKGNGAYSMQEKVFRLALPKENIKGNGNDFVINFDSSQAIILQNIYKSFVLYFISLYGHNMESDEVSLLSKWLFENPNFINLPLIAIQVFPSMYKELPCAMCYERISEDKNLPKYILEFHFLSFVYIVIMPFIDEMNCLYCKKDDFIKLWSIFKHWPPIDNWVFRDFSNHVKQKIHYNWKFKKNNQ